MKAKKLKQALQEMAEEGVVQVFRPTDGSPALVGVVGPLQLDVLRARLDDEYGLEVDWDVAEFQLARWIAADDPKVLEAFVAAHRSAIAEDLDGDLVFLARNAFNLDYTGRESPGIGLHRREGHSHKDFLSLQCRSRESGDDRQTVSALNSAGLPFAAWSTRPIRTRSSRPTCGRPSWFPHSCRRLQASPRCRWRLAEPT